MPIEHFGLVGCSGLVIEYWSSNYLQHLLFLHKYGKYFPCLGGSAREEDASTEMTAEHESEHIERDMTGDASVDILQPGSDDMETSSSGSSIELLDVSDEGLSHSQADDNETSGQGLNDSDKEDGRDMVPGSDGEESVSYTHLTLPTKRIV